MFWLKQMYKIQNLITFYCWKINTCATAHRCSWWVKGRELQRVVWSQGKANVVWGISQASLTDNWRMLLWSVWWLQVMFWCGPIALNSLEFQKKNCSFFKFPHYCVAGIKLTIFRSLIISGLHGLTYDFPCYYILTPQKMHATKSDIAKLELWLEIKFWLIFPQVYKSITFTCAFSFSLIITNIYTAEF